MLRNDLTDGLLVWLEGKENEADCIILTTAADFDGYGNDDDYSRGYVVYRLSPTGESKDVVHFTSLKSALENYAQALPPGA